MKKLMQKTKENVQERILLNLAGKFSRNLAVLVPEAFREIGKVGESHGIADVGDIVPVGILQHFSRNGKAD